MSTIALMHMVRDITTVLSMFSHARYKYYTRPHNKNNNKSINKFFCTHFFSITTSAAICLDTLSSFISTILDCKKAYKSFWLVSSISSLATLLNHKQPKEHKDTMDITQYSLTQVTTHPTCFKGERETCNRAVKPPLEKP